MVTYKINFEKEYEIVKKLRDVKRYFFGFPFEKEIPILDDLIDEVTEHVVNCVKIYATSMINNNETRFEI